MYYSLIPPFLPQSELLRAYCGEVFFAVFFFARRDFAQNMSILRTYAHNKHKHPLKKSNVKRKGCVKCNDKYQ